MSPSRDSAVAGSNGTKRADVPFSRLEFRPSRLLHLDPGLCGGEPGRNSGAKLQNL